MDCAAASCIRYVSGISHRCLCEFWRSPIALDRKLLPLASFLQLGVTKGGNRNPRPSDVPPFRCSKNVSRKVAGSLLNSWNVHFVQRLFKQTGFATADDG